MSVLHILILSVCLILRKFGIYVKFILYKRRKKRKNQHKSDGEMNVFLYELFGRIISQIEPKTMIPATDIVHAFKNPVIYRYLPRTAALLPAFIIIVVTIMNITVTAAIIENSTDTESPSLEIQVISFGSDTGSATAAVILNRIKRALSFKTA